MKKLLIIFLGFIGLMSFGVFTAKNVNALGTTHSITFQSMFDAGNIGEPISLGTQSYKTTIQLETHVNDAVSPEGDYVFAFWVVNDVVRTDLPVDYTFTVIGDLDVIAVFSKVGEHAVLFMDSNAKLIDSQYVLNGANANDSALSLPDKPGYQVSSTTKWSESTENITDDVALILRYDKVTDDTFTLTVTDGSGSGTYNYNAVVTVNANENETPFSHWEDADGIILSTNSEYKFTMLENKEITAVYSASPEADSARVILSEDLVIREGYNSYLSQFYIPDGYTLVDFGMLTLHEDKYIADFDTEGVVINQGFKYYNFTNEFIMSFAVGSHYSIRAYLIIEDNLGNLTKYYSEMNPRYKHQGPVDLGTAYNFAILSEAGISTTGTTAITGDIGVSPIDQTALTGFSETMDGTNQFSRSDYVTGKLYAADYTEPTPTMLGVAIGDLGIAYTDANSRTPDADKIELYTGLLSGVTLEPGVYQWNTSVEINGHIYLDGSPTDTWIFQVRGDLSQAANFSIILTGGAVAENIVWVVTGEVEVLAGAHFEGTILCKTAVHFRTGASINGRILSQTAVTLQGNKVN